MKKVWTLIACMGLLGCTALMSQTPVNRSMTFPEAPDVAYARATRAMARLGGEVTQGNTQTRTMSAKVHNALILNVLVEQVPEGSRIEAICTLLPNKIALGEMTECDQYLALLP